MLGVHAHPDCISHNDVQSFAKWFKRIFFAIEVLKKSNLSFVSYGFFYFSTNVMPFNFGMKITGPGKRFFFSLHLIFDELEIRNCMKLPGDLLCKRL